MSGREKVLSVAVVALTGLLVLALFRGRGDADLRRETLPPKAERNRVAEAPAASAALPESPAPVVPPAESTPPVQAPKAAEPEGSKSANIPPPKDENEKAALLSTLTAGDEPARLNAFKRLYAHLFRNSQDVAVLAALQNATISDPSESVRKYGLFTMVSMPDQRSFEIVLQSAAGVIPQPEEIQLRAIDNLQHLAESGYPRFLIALGCSRESADALARQRLDQARKTLEYLAASAPSETVSKDAKAKLAGLPRSR